MDEQNVPVPEQIPAPAAPQAEPAHVQPTLTPAQVTAMLGQQQICPRCHFPTKPEYYYCPNCGAKLSEAPIGTGVMDQLLLYAFSAVLPWIAYLAISKWQGIKYLRAPDPRARQIGLIALVLLVISSIIAFWLTYQWIESYINQSLNDVNNLGNI